MTARPIGSAALTVLFADREHPAAGKCLAAWLEPQNASTVLARFRERYLLIASADLHREARYLHLVEFLRDVDALLACLITHLDDVVRMPGPSSLGPIDFKFLLNPNDRARVDAMLDEREAAQLRCAKVAGHA